MLADEKHGVFAESFEAAVGGALGGALYGPGVAVGARDGGEVEEVGEDIEADLDGECANGGVRRSCGDGDGHSIRRVGRRG